jgi:proton-dependent oligopeptide transporter, POT family
MGILRRVCKPCKFPCPINVARAVSRGHAPGEHQVSSYSPATSPDHTTTAWPKGVKYIIGNEGCERFSYYGMKAILFIYSQFLIATVMGVGAEDATASGQAKALVHFFGAGVYGLAMLGAIIADRLLGKYRTILWLSIVYCAGHFVLAMSEGPIYDSIYGAIVGGVHDVEGHAQGSLYGLYLGLILIGIGSGGIKPCVSAHVGDQFGKKNWFRLRTVFQGFYFIINFGSMFATILIPWVYHAKGTFGVWSTGLAFGIPGILMAIATIFFWMGRKVFVHVPAKPAGRLGVLDAVSSGLLFFTFGHFFFSGNASLGVQLGLSFGFLVAGFALFAYRQRLEADDGFMAVLFYSVTQWFKPQPQLATAGAGGADMAVSGKAGPSDIDDLIVQLKADVPAEQGARREKLARSRFYGPSVKRFGIEATEGPVAVLKIIGVFAFVSLFWALFDQHASSWIQQGQKMNPVLWGDFAIRPSQVSAVNPALVMLLIPIMSIFVYPGVEKLGIRATPLRRMTVGMFIASLSFVVVAVIQSRVDTGGAGTVSIWWQLAPYTVITLAEVLVSITGLEFAYSQAPNRMKSTIMGFWLMAVALGNVLAGVIFGGENAFFTMLLSNIGSAMSIAANGLEAQFWLFAMLMGLAACGFGLISRFYKGQEYVQN